MKSIVFYEHGGIDVLKYEDMPVPEPGPGEVLVQLKASALNRLDLWVREGWPGIRLKYPHIPGADGAGFVAGLGENVENWKIGDSVVINANIGCGECDFCLSGKDNMCLKWTLLGENRAGTYSEYIVVPERQLFALGKDFDKHTAAAAGLVFHTAWHSLITRGNLKPGEKVLIVGASGGVNTASIQVAKYAGADVYVVGSNSKKLALAESLGADYLIDRSRTENWSKEIYRSTNKQGVDVVVDNVGTTFPLSFRAASKGGRILTVGNTGGAKFQIDNRFIFGKHLSIIGSSMGTIQDFNAVMTLVAAGKLMVAMDRQFPLEDAWKAQERLQSGQQLGKITLSII